ncbi:hypothetical protein PHYPO_G00226830 [Pangasianodon hypophthalmus]|uniref:RIB43A-like with coiled-coils protein 2 n=1 Tax=Pangasianodon hypophthalmus TaxID=310915 RepID=A0A5N5NVX1_PANHP|nr:hypothetical protein PHYPO_G00226830 [Pangasianodon hypophthalmus]
MNRMEVLSERVAAAHLDRRRQRELQRQERIFNTKVRTIGVDKEALQHQVEEKRAQRDSESRAVKEHSDDLIHTDRAACLLESRQKKDKRLLAEAIVNFCQQFQQPSSRREFDLNDPEVLKKQEGVRVLPGLAGEDLGSEDRTRRQREQLRDWTLQQQQELDQAKELQRLQGNSGLQDFRRWRKSTKRATNIAIKDFNRALAVELREQRERERRQVEENNRTDILNHLQGELLSESVQRSARVRRDCYKGMTPEQIRE